MLTTICYHVGRPLPRFCDCRRLDRMHTLLCFCSRRSDTATLMCAFFLLSLRRMHTLLCFCSRRSDTATLLCAFFLLSLLRMHTLLCVFYPVKHTMTQWLNLSKNGQDARVSHCTLLVLEQCVHEQCVHELCNATNRDPARCLFRSKHALASNIGDIFRSCLRGMLGLLTPRARHFCLPFIRDGSFTSFTVQ